MSQQCGYSLLDWLYCYYRPQRSWGKVIFSQASVILFTGGSASVHAGIPPPPGTRHPPDQAPPLPGTRAYWEIWSTSGRYTSYWNAILLFCCCCLSFFCRKTGHFSQSLFRWKLSLQHYQSTQCNECKDSQESYYPLWAGASSKRKLTARHRSCGKVMFLNLSVSHSVHRGVSVQGVCIPACTRQTPPGSRLHQVRLQRAPGCNEQISLHQNHWQ